MVKKDLIRKRYLKKRKKKYLEINEKFFTPLKKLFKEKIKFNKKLIFSLYFPSSYEVNVLKILDIDTWEGKTSWSTSCDDFDEILPGYEIKHEEMGIGRVIQWPIVMMTSGVVCEFPQENIR